MQAFVFGPEGRLVFIHVCSLGSGEREGNEMIGIKERKSRLLYSPHSCFLEGVPQSKLGGVLRGKKKGEKEGGGKRRKEKSKFELVEQIIDSLVRGKFFENKLLGGVHALCVDSFVADHAKNLRPRQA